MPGIRARGALIGLLPTEDFTKKNGARVLRLYLLASRDRNLEFRDSTIQVTDGPLYPQKLMPRCALI